MNKTIQDLYAFIQNVEHNSINIDVDTAKYKKISKYIDGKIGAYQDQIESKSKEIQDGLNIRLSNSQKELFFVDTSKLNWGRGEQISQEGTLAGGFYINGIRGMFLEPNDFWKDIAEVFKEVGQEDRLEIPRGFSWLTGTHAVNSARRLCHYGCVKLEQGKFPAEFYFFDSGLLFPLPFKTVEEYIQAMITSAAVECWQYFYIDPELVISKSKGLSYFTWDLHFRTCLGNDLDELFFVENAPHDRLDLIAEYLERCVNLLPETFPFLDFKHHKQYLSDFLALYRV